MSAEEERFQLTNQRSHWSWNINFKLTKKVSVIFHNLRGYQSHLIRNSWLLQLRQIWFLLTACNL